MTPTVSTSTRLPATRRCDEQRTWKGRDADAAQAADRVEDAGGLPVARCWFINTYVGVVPTSRDATRLPVEDQAARGRSRAARIASAPANVYASYRSVSMEKGRAMSLLTHWHLSDDPADVPDSG